MHSVLLVVDKPDAGDHVGNKKWRDFLGDIQSTIARSSEIEVLGERCWLIPLDKGVGTLASLVYFAEARDLTYRVLFFEDAPQWVTNAH